MAYNAQNKTGARVAIYVRVSTLHQIDRDSLPMQKQDLLAYAKLMLNTDDWNTQTKGTAARIQTVLNFRK